MAKGTVLTLFFLSIIASILVGINIGKKIGNTDLVSVPTQIARKSLSPTPTPTSAPKDLLETIAGKTVYTNVTCGYQISFPPKWTKTNYDPRSVSIATAETQGSPKIAIVCAPEIPKPALVPNKIVDTKLGTASAKLYHDTSQKDGSPLDEVITRIPGKDMEIFVAGFGPTLQQILSSFKFLD